MPHHARLRKQTDLQVATRKGKTKTVAKLHTVHADSGAMGIQCLTVPKETNRPLKVTY
jgi:hypothetical protein